jgi:[ribosomal protein S5]-alanine N-acetyltransferase
LGVLNRTDYFDTSAGPKQRSVAGTKSFEWGAHLPTLRAPRLTLRAVTEADVADVLSVFSDPLVLRYWDGPLMTTQQDAMRYIERIQYGFRRRELLQWGIADTATGPIVGTCTLIHLSLAHGRAEIGFALKQARWGQGLGSEAVVAVIEFAFEQLCLHRIEADVDPRNERSLRLLDGLGFRREGHLRERYYMNGERQDAIMMAMLRREWKSPGNAAPINGCPT